ncbi:MAG: putative Ig domain-containing protein, partial [Kiritimatiellae bacterium]|nr:putative Ig domain-containing protein [Kiritimatiellia bacterium]
DSLARIVVGRNVAWIDSDAFGGCDALDVVLIDDDPLFDPSGVSLPGNAQIVRQSDYFEIATETLSDATAGADYEAELATDGGRGEFRWEDREGLPNGLQIDSEGRIYGTPEESGTFEVRIRATAECGFWREAVLTLRVEQGQTESTPVPVPFDWIADRAGSFLDAVGGDYEAAALAVARNGRPVWECYVADLDPENADDDLVATIEMVDGKPEVRIEWGESAARDYTTQGAKTLGGGWDDLEDGADWDAAGYRFFRVKVELP